MTKVIKIEKALLLTRIVKRVQEEISMENLGVQVYNLQEKVILEKVAKEVFNERREDNNLETGGVEEIEILNPQQKEEVLVRKYFVFGAEAITIKQEPVLGSRPSAKTVVKNVLSTTKTSFAIKDDQITKVQEELVKEEKMEEEWTRGERESMLWNFKKMKTPLLL